MRDVAMKPREKEKRSPEELRQILAKIYPEDMVDELMKKLGMEVDSKDGE